MDIIGAMNKEREYLSFRVKGEEPYHFADAVKEYGFESIKEYFDAKCDYEFSQLKFEVVEAKPERAIAKVGELLASNKTAILFVLSDKTFIWNGTSGEYEPIYCEQCNIPVYPILTSGGTIVSTYGDLNIGVCIPLHNGNIGEYILNSLAKIFRKYTHKTVEIAGNDVMIAGSKVVGSSVYAREKRFMLVASISMSDKTELIARICKKHSVKQPGYIDFMTVDQLRGEIEKWLKINSD